MKIGLVCPYNMDKHGGVLEVVLSLYDGFTKDGHDVRIITPRPRGQEVKERKDVIYMGTSTDFRSPAATTTQISSADDNDKTDAILRQENFDILHFHEPWVPLLSRQLAQRSTCVNVATFHGMVPETLLTRTVIKVVNPYFKSVMAYLHEMTAVSASGASYASTMTEQPIKIIPNGIDLKKYTAPKGQKVRPQTKTVLYVGRLERRKGVKYLLQAFQIFADKNPDYELLIAGDGPDREKLELLVEDLKIKKVKFLGYVSEELKLKLFNEAALFCSPAIFGESFGIVLLEAMAMGAICLAGNNSGYSDLMQGTGALSIINPEDTTEFARRMDLLIHDEELRRIWQAWAKDYVKQFNYPNIVKQYESFYEQSIKDHKGEIKSEP